MKRFIKSLVVSAIVAIVLSSTVDTMAQGRQRQGQQGQGGGPGGNFDPEQMRQRMMDRYKEMLNVTDDAEWKIIQERLTKVMEAQRDARSGGGGFGMMMRPRGNQGDAQADNQQQRRGGMFGGEPMPEAEALQKAIDGKASKDELKAKLAAFREAKKAKQAALEKAQKELKDVLNTTQEAILVSAGMMP